MYQVCSNTSHYMDTLRTTFEEWRTRHTQELVREYRQYLRDILDDDGFDIRHVEDYWMWTDREYEILHREPTDEGT